MEYKGKLYGKFGNKYFDTGKTSDDWDRIETGYNKAKLLLADEEVNIDLVNINKSAKDVINYVEFDAAIAMPIDELMGEDGRHLSKKEYGKVLLKYLVIELKAHFC